MKKGYYIHFQGRSSMGVSKKIDMQMDAFQKFYDMQEIEVGTPERSLVERIIALFPICSIRRDYGHAIEAINDPVFLYVRRTVADRAYVKFLKQIKQKFPSCKIIVEIFTYPYDKDEFWEWNAWPFYLKEIIYRRQLKRYVDRFVTYSDDDVLFGVPTIRTINGVNVKSIPPIEPSNEYNPNEIHLIAVAVFSRHHGYERVIRGLYEYYQIEQDREVYVHMVGDGPEYKRYKSLVKKCKLEKYVRFYGPKYGKELDALYNIADAGLAGYGGYKDGVFKSSGIKTREYLAKGLPAITGAEDDLLPDDVKYGLTFPNNPTPVDIAKMAEYLDNLYLYKDKRSVHGEIRNYVQQYADNEVALLPVMEYIDN